VQRHPTQHNIENYRVIRAQTRRVIKTSKRHSWQTYVSKINSRTSINKVWSMVRNIAGKSPSCNIKHLNTNNTEITEIPDISNSLGQTFSKNSSSNNYSNKFQAFRNQTENQHLKFKSNNLETYNNPFSLDELWDAISKSHDSAVGTDDIHYLPPNAVNTLLQALNNIWFAGNFPPSWRTSTVIPIPKPAKDTSNPNNYRPIALTSCLCKVMERMVNNRLVWFLERNKL